MMTKMDERWWWWWWWWWRRCTCLFVRTTTLIKFKMLSSLLLLLFLFLYEFSDFFNMGFEKLIIIIIFCFSFFLSLGEFFLFKKNFFLFCFSRWNSLSQHNFLTVEFYEYRATCRYEWLGLGYEESRRWGHWWCKWCKCDVMCSKHGKGINNLFFYLFIRYKFFIFIITIIK